MRWPRGWAWLRSSWWRSRRERNAAFGAVALSGISVAVVYRFAADVLADAGIRAAEQYVSYGALVAVAVAAVAIRVARAFTKQPPEPEVPPLTFPAKAAPLIGRDGAVAAVVQRARRSGMVLVRGPAGVGTSTVAINAAWELAPDTDRQRYVDLSGQDPDRIEDALSVARHVLRVVGGDPGEVETVGAAAALLADALHATGQVLVIDDVARWDQVAWLPHDPDAKIIVAGTLEGAEPADGPLEIRPLTAAEGLALLRALTPAHDTRLDREREAADRLAQLCLRLPATILIVAAWLSKNRRSSLADLVEWLLHDEGHDGDVRDRLGKRLLHGTGRTASWLLPILAHLPVEEVEKATVLALTGRNQADVRGALEELEERCLLESPRSPSRIRVVQTARLITEPPRAIAVYRRRLVEYLAERADHYAERLPEEDAVRWFAVEDKALLAILQDEDLEPRLEGCYWRIADALDAWHSLGRRQSDRKDAAGALAFAARRLQDDQALLTARLRLAVIELTRGEVEDARQRVLELEQEIPQDGRPPQLQLLRAAVDLLTQDDMRVVEEALVRYRQGLPASDLAGRAMAMSNLCLRVLYGGGQDVPGNLIDVAGWAREAADLGAAAHAHEVRGLSLWNRDMVKEARDDWEEAATLYREAGESLGHARCQVHIAATDLNEDLREQAAARLVQARMRLPDTGVERALAGLYLGMAEPDQAAEHARDGLRALAPWVPNDREPPAIREIRRRLQELRGDRP